jgi:aminopyrrolnitrin oxygenase
MLHDAPAVTAFPKYPASWYLFCATSELSRRPLTKAMLGRRLVAFRTESGRLALMEAQCSHLGADLGRGCVVGETIRCPYHHWQYGTDGRCASIPAQATVPSFARQTTYPITERHGYLFFFNAPKPLFPLPFFFDERPEEFVAGLPFRFVADCTWYMLAANGFDAEHFGTVHDRTLIGPPVVDCPSAFARRMRYQALVTGKSIFDRLIRPTAGRRVEVSITSWGGPLVLVTGFFERARSYILIASQPLDGGKTLVEVIVFARRTRFAVTRLFQPLGLLIRRWLTQGFMLDDINRLGGIRYNPDSLVESDQLLRDYFFWAADLPKQGRPRPADSSNAVHQDRAELLSFEI